MNKNNSFLDALEKHFNPRESVPDYKKFLNKSFQNSKNANLILEGHRDIKYGNGSLQNLDIFGNKKAYKSPIHIFIHGGYWRALDKNYHYHMALPFNDHNIIFCNLNYDLCPKVSINEICNQVIDAIIWIFKNYETYNYDREKITISGHSAGAHLASYLISTKWERYDLPKNIIKGAALISGIYDLEIVKKISVNDDLNLTDVDVEKLSTIKRLPTQNLPLIVAYGGKEPEGWKNQSLEYKKNLEKNNFNVQDVICNNDNHFSLIDSLANKNTKICKNIIKLAAVV